MLTGLNFQKAYFGTYSDTVYKVVQVLLQRRPLRYQLQEADSGQDVKGLYYEAELISGENG